MRFVCLLMVVTWTLTWMGCGGTPSSGNDPGLTDPVTPAASEVIVTPSGTFVGKVARYNADNQYAVVSFPIGSMPALNQVMHVYRNGLKVGELKITGPQRENNTAGDLTRGQVQVGDEGRENCT